jgi:endoglucanase
MNIFRLHGLLTGIIQLAFLPLISGQECIRVNQVGYLTGDKKIALVGVQRAFDLSGKGFSVITADSPRKTAFTGKIGNSRGSKNTPFKAVYPCDFSGLTTSGTYRLRLTDSTMSPSFTIGATEEYRKAFSLLLEFYRSQRCGNTDPLLHKPCHLNDAKGVIDASGGWHDAGDYIKFMITAGFVTDQLCIALDYAKQFGFYDRLPDVSPKNNIPDLLEEARIGTDWILKMTADYKKGNYYFQVSGKEDHKLWRLPSDDDSTGKAGNPRPLHKGWGGNLLGKSAAALALGARIFAQDSAYAHACRERAEALFKQRDHYKNNCTSVPSDFYEETSWQDDMVLAAAELYMTTKKTAYSRYAEQNLPKLTKCNISWDECDYLAFAECYRAGVRQEACKQSMRGELAKLVRLCSRDPMYFALEGFTWGSCPEFMGNAQKAIMYFLLTKDPAYLDMAAAQRDFLLGRNNWGLSFVIGLGSKFPVHAHSQINSLLTLQRGGVVGGPIDIKEWLSTAEFDTALVRRDDGNANFQGGVVYFDNQLDYITNEVAIDYAASTLFVLMCNFAGVSSPARAR